MDALHDRQEEIGLVLAAAFARAGAAVTLVTRTADVVEAAIRAPGCKAEVAVLDVSDLSAGAAFFNGRLAFYALANNAGTDRPTEADDHSERSRL